MDIIYLILTNLRRLLRNKKLITLIILLFLILNLLSLFSNVKANSNSINHNGTTINLTYFNNTQSAFLIYDKENNNYLSFELFRTSFGVGTNPRFFITQEDDNYIYIDGLCNEDGYNCTAIYNYDISSGSCTTVFSSTNYGYSGSYAIDKNRYSFVYKADNVKIYTDSSCTVENITSKFFNTINFTIPSITTTVNAFKYWNFNTVEINGGDFDLNKGDMEFIVNYYNQIGSSEDSPFQKYETSTKIKLNKESLFVNINEENGQAFFTASIPRSELLKNVNIRNGAFIDIGLHGSYWASNLPNGEITCDIVESGISLVLDSKYEEDLQKEKESQERQELIKNQKETNEKLEETNNNIKDTNDFLKNDNVPDDSDFDLPSVEVDDPTANFFDTMFMGLYNAINVEGNQQISFKIFSKDIVINSNDFNFLVGNEWGILRVILTSSWVFGIGIFILKDIRKMIDKIKSGNIDSVATDDIKADMV